MKTLLECPQEWDLPIPLFFFFHYFSKFMGILLFVLKYMYTSLLLKMINGFSWPARIMVSPFKGALDKYNIYLFISYSIEDFKLIQYWNFQLILPMRFHFMRYFVNSIISRVSHRLLYSVFYWSRLWKIQNARNVPISSKVNQSGTYNSACSHYPCQHF